MIEVKHLSFTYPGKIEPTVKDLHVSIQSGEVFGFLGPSGAGKSTTQKILIGILKQYQGSAQVLGQEVRRAGNQYYEQIGVAFEFPNFYSRFTALENLSFFRSMYTKKTLDPKLLLERMNLLPFADTKVADFSKGMKMRLNLCRALLHEPELLFLDEPTSGLDPVNAKKVKDLILELKKEGKTILITTHNMHTAEEICDRVAFIVDGEIRLIDSPRELKVRKGRKSVRIEHRNGTEISHTDFDLDSIGCNPAFLDLLRSHTIETIHSQEASLEDIFIEITGRKLE